MADRLVINLNEREVGALLKSADVAAEVKRRADRIAAAAGPGMLASVIIGKNRAHGSVITATLQARRAQATRRALIRALDAGRG